MSLLPVTYTLSPSGETAMPGPPSPRPPSLPGHSLPSRLLSWMQPSGGEAGRASRRALRANSATSEQLPIARSRCVGAAAYTSCAVRADRRARSRSPIPLPVRATADVGALSWRQSLGPAAGSAFRRAPRENSAIGPPTASRRGVDVVAVWADRPVRRDSPSHCRSPWCRSPRRRPGLPMHVEPLAGSAIRPAPRANSAIEPLASFGSRRRVDVGAIGADDDACRPQPSRTPFEPHSVLSAFSSWMQAASPARSASRPRPGRRWRRPRRPVDRRIRSVPSGLTARALRARRSRSASVVTTGESSSCPRRCSRAGPGVSDPSVLRANSVMCRSGRCPQQRRRRSCRPG